MHIYGLGNSIFGQIVTEGSDSSIFISLQAKMQIPSININDVQRDRGQFTLQKNQFKNTIVFLNDHEHCSKNALQIVGVC